MKKLVFIVCLFAIVCSLSMTFSCTGKAQEDSIDTLSIDSSAIDSIEEVAEETPMPKAADGLFDDFFFNFASNKKLQMKRIKFPLPVDGDKKVCSISQEEWKMDPFFIHQEFYTLIFDNQRQMEVVKDTSINHAIVERIYLHRNFVKQYIFDRINGEWMMTRINNTTFNNLPNSSFLAFYDKFVTDSTFQMESIHDPLEFSGPDPDDDFSTMEGLLLPEQWPSFAPPLPNGMIYNIIYGVQGKGSTQKILMVRGISNGLEDELTFRKKDGKWYLTKIVM